MLKENQPRAERQTAYSAKGLLSVINDSLKDSPPVEKAYNVTDSQISYAARERALKAAKNEIPATLGATEHYTQFGQIVQREIDSLTQARDKSLKALYANKTGYHTNEDKSLKGYADADLAVAHFETNRGKRPDAQRKQEIITSSLRSGHASLQESPQPTLVFNPESKFADSIGPLINNTVFTKRAAEDYKTIVPNIKISKPPQEPISISTEPDVSKTQSSFWSKISDTTIGRVFGRLWIGRKSSPAASQA